MTFEVPPSKCVCLAYENLSFSLSSEGIITDLGSTGFGLPLNQRFQNYLPSSASEYQILISSLGVALGCSKSIGSALREHPGGAETAAVSSPDPTGGEVSTLILGAT